MYIDPEKPQQNTWLYHINKIYDALSNGGSGEETARHALEIANQAIEAARQANEAAAQANEAAAQALEIAQASKVPDHTSADQDKVLAVGSDGSLNWANNPSWN